LAPLKTSTEWAGVQYSWASYHTLVPLILGLCGLGLVLFYEARYARNAVVPFDLFQHLTSLAGYIAVFLHGVAVPNIVYYLPTYFQAAHQASPAQAGVDLFGSAFIIAPFAILCGVSVGISGRYLPQNYIGWMMLMIGAGVMSLLKSTSPKAMWVGLQVPGAIGYGINYAAPMFAMLAPMPISKNARALAFFTFVRNFGQTWGITIGGTILQNGLKKRLPAEFLATFPAGVQISYSLIPKIPTISEPLRSEIKAAFADSISVIWLVCVGLGGAGLLVTLLMREVKLHEVTDDKWGFEKREGKGGTEGPVAVTAVDIENQHSTPQTQTLEKTGEIAATSSVEHEKEETDSNATH